MNSKTKAEALRRLSGFVVCAKCDAVSPPSEVIWHTDARWRLRQATSTPYCSMFCALTTTPRAIGDALMTRVQWIDGEDTWPASSAIRVASVTEPLSWKMTETGESAWLAENAARLRAAGEIR
jgi:hypothetical protein